MNNRLPYFFSMQQPPRPQDPPHFYLPVYAAVSAEDILKNGILQAEKYNCPDVKAKLEERLLAIQQWRAALKENPSPQPDERNLKFPFEKS